MPSSYVAQAPQPKTPESILAGRSLDVLSKNKEKVYSAVHLNHVGHATGITVQSVKILAWEDGKPEGQLDSIKQFEIHFTLFWTSLEHPNSGVTELVWTLEKGPDGKCHFIGSQVVKTNGITRDKVLSEAVPFLMKLGLHGL